MPKKSFLEQMGLVERTNKQDDSSIAKRSTIDDENNADVGRTSNFQGVDSKLQDLERKNRLLDDFNSGNTTSFGFAGDDILEEGKSVILDDLIPSDLLKTNQQDNTNSQTNREHETSGVSAMESEFAAAAEAMRKEDGAVEETGRVDAASDIATEESNGDSPNYDSHEFERDMEINKSIDELMGLNKAGKYDAAVRNAVHNSTLDFDRNLHQNNSHDIAKDFKREAPADVDFQKDIGIHKDETRSLLNQNETVFAHYDDPPRGLMSGEDLMMSNGNAISPDSNIASEGTSMQDFEFFSSKTISSHKESSQLDEQIDIDAEEVNFVEAGNDTVPYHTQIADRVGDALKADENLKANSTFKADPYIGDKLDLIIGAYEKNKLLTIEEIYRNSRMETDTKKTIFMTDVFLKAIPTNLPLDVKRETVLNILKISGIELEMLLSDAYKRIDSLNKVHEDTIATSNDIYQRNENTIRELERRIQDLRDINSARQVFQEDQNTMIEYEMQKIINLVEFVKPKTR